MKNNKAYTGLEQSKILSGILHKGTADFCWGLDEGHLENGLRVYEYNAVPYPLPWKDYTAKDDYLPCWSLAALLDQMDESITTDDGEYNLHIFSENGGYYVQYDDNYEGEILVESGFQERLIDAVFDVIIKLNELGY